MLQQQKTRLTTRELHVLLEVLKGKTSKEIADALFITHHTVKAHLKNIFIKAGVTNRIELILKLFDTLQKDNLSTLQINNAIDRIIIENTSNSI